ncbi:MAG: right-handed parallel beta-helix repeat-containing protein [candidate division Zixibacteria bacterium]|nr:right-handed parallel beta-helix repeat-containing protein [candidate division Zixibacteria bacterium]
MLFLGFFFTSVVAFEPNFHRGVYGPLHTPDFRSYPYFDKTKSHGFNCAHSLPWGFTYADYDSASVDTLNLIDYIYLQPGNGLYSKYEADRHNLRDYYQPYPGDQIRFLSTRLDHNGYGNQVQDPDAGNGYAWFESKDSVTHNGGLVLWGLWHEQPDCDRIRDTCCIVDYSREMLCSNSWWGCYYELIYYARFNLKVPVTPGAQPLDSVARIEVHYMNAVRDSVVADSLLLYGDFTLGQYRIFELSFHNQIPYGNDSVDYRVHWFKNTDLFIDYVEVYDCIYDTLMNHSPTYQDRIIAQVSTLENQYHGTSLFRWYLRDEPAYVHYKTNREISHLLDSLNYVPGIQATGDAAWHHPKKFADEVQPHEICYDDYPIATWVVPESLQYLLNLFTWRIRQAAEAAREHNIEWWYVAQTLRDPYWWRYSHNSELRTTVYLSLAYGAKGMEYFRYSSHPQWTPQNPAWQSGLLWWNEDVQDWVPIETYPGPNPYSSQPETLLTEVVQINFWLDSLGTTLRSLDWIDACLDSSYNNNDLHGCGGSYLDSIRSPGHEPHWVQVGFFENQTGDTSYFMLVNRECLATEGANYDVFLSKAGGPFYIRDMYLNTKVGMVNGIGDMFTVYLGPGEGKLFRLEPFTPSPHVIRIPVDFQTIQEGIDSASNGDTVLVAPGTYYENINFRGKAITVASHFIYDHNSATIEATIIDGSEPINPDSGSVVTFVSGEDSISILIGFTITGGTGTNFYLGRWQRHGGGIYCFSSSPTIMNNLIINNHIPSEPGGMWELGGGMSCRGTSSPLIVNNLIILNSCDDGGGGICIESGGSPRIVNNTISNNGSDGMLIWNVCTHNVSNNIIVNNDGHGMSFMNCSSYYGISHNDVWNNADGNFDAEGYPPPEIGDTTWGTNVNGIPCDSYHNIIRNPMFVNPDTDYHLQENSPCVNAGDKYISGLPDFDFDFKPRIRGCRVDMGVYEYDYQYEYTCGDANGDHKVTVSDAVYLVNYLFKGGQTPIPIQSGDANCDGKVTVSDVVYLVNYLFKGGPPPC